MKIHVRQEHIDKGEPQRAGKCAVALAGQDQVECRNFMVCSDFVQVHFGNYKHRKFPINQLASDWIKNFDKARDKSSIRPTIIDVPGLEDYVRPKVAEPVLEQRPSLPQVKEEALV